jgi:xylose isomerase
MLEQSSYDGKYDKNPFNFKHFNVGEISLVVNGNFLTNIILIIRTNI